MSEIPAKKYPSKILLVGEYLVIDGSPALATPFDRYFGEWDFTTIIDNRLLDLLDFLKRKNIELDLLKFEEEIHLGLTFNSNIPNGYGCGSSGALVAGVYERYSKNYLSNPALVKNLSLIESFYHGNSSGIDPYVSLIKSDTLIKENQIKATTLRASALDNLYLINTNKSRKTEPLVKLYKQLRKDKSFLRIVPKLLELNTALINNFVSTGVNQDALGDLMREMAVIQYEYMSFAYPESIRQSWQSRFENGNYLKLCGAGGGGFFIVYSTNPEEEWIPLTKNENSN